jgi:hypothetical protein
VTSGAATNFHRTPEHQAVMAALRNTGGLKAYEIQFGTPAAS